MKSRLELLRSLRSIKLFILSGGNLTKISRYYYIILALGPDIIASFAQSKVSQPLIDVAENRENTIRRKDVVSPRPGLTFSFPDIFLLLAL